MLEVVVVLKWLDLADVLLLAFTVQAKNTAQRRYKMQNVGSMRLQRPTFLLSNFK
jgi:hypothetical protein